MTLECETSSTTAQVPVVGAGPAGLAVVHELVRHSIHPRVIDAANQATRLLSRIARGDLEALGLPRPSATAIPRTLYVRGPEARRLAHAIATWSPTAAASTTTAHQYQQIGTLV